MVASIVLAGDAFSSDEIASGQSAPNTVPTFCYAFGSAQDGSATTYYTGVFQATASDLNGAQTAFRQFLASKYGSQPDARAGDRDITCTMMPSQTPDATTQQQLETYAANMRRGGGKVVESGWQYTAPAPSAPPPAEAVTLPSDPRIASATPEMRHLLEDRKKAAHQMCLLENQKGGTDAVYDCPCYEDRVVIASLDVGSTIVPSVDEQHRPVSMLSPPIELVVPRGDFHTCLNTALLPKRAYEKGIQMSGMYVGDAKQRLAQCMSDETMAAFAANASTSIQKFDNLVMNAYGTCASKVQ
jgi:hypothetical protein